MRYIFLKLKSRNGEYEYYHLSIHTLESSVDAKTWVEEYAKTFYGEGEKEFEDDNVYFFNCGEVCVSIETWKDITEEEYNILKKFL